MGVLPNIVVVDEVLLRTRSHQTEGTKKVISEETTNIAPANKRIETTQTNSYTQRNLQFITNDRTPSIAPVFQRSLDRSTVATVPFTRPSSKFFLWKNAKRRRSHFLLLSISGNGENIGYKSDLGWWVVVWAYWLDKESSLVVWFSDILASGSRCHTLYGIRKLLKVRCL